MTTIDLTDELRAIEETLGGGVLGVCAVSSNDQTVEYNADELFPLASVIKAVIVAEWCVQAGVGDRWMHETATVSDDDRVAGSGILARLNSGHSFEINELAVLATAISDNTASNMILRAVGGIEVVNKRMHNEWNMPNTTIHRPIKFHLASTDPPHTATGTPRDMCYFMDGIASSKLLGDSMYDETTLFHIETLLGMCDDTAMLPRYLDVNAFAIDLDTAAPPMQVFHKPGAVTGVRNDAGYVRRNGSPGHVAMAIFTKEVPDSRWTEANAGCEAVARVAELLVRRLRL